MSRGTLGRNKPDPCGGCWITALNGYCRAMAAVLTCRLTSCNVNSKNVSNGCHHENCKDRPVFPAPVDLDTTWIRAEHRLQTVHAEERTPRHSFRRPRRAHVLSCRYLQRGFAR